ncbi:MAG: M61 family peptidase [Terriglobales bacterium]
MSSRWLSLAAVMPVFLGAGLAAAQAPITLTVDASQAPLKMIYTHEVLPVQPGELTLYYPKWIPGEHEPDGPIGDLTGLVFTAGGKPLPWRRDLKDVFTFHVTVPAGVNKLDVAFDYIEASSGEYTSGGSATAKLVDINWNQNLLYPANVPDSKIVFDATLVVPPNWQYGTALPVAHGHGNRIQFKPAEMELLVDSPVIAGEYYRSIDLTPPGEKIHHEIDMVADSPEALAMPPQVQQGLKNLVAETGALFGSRHYRDYHFLLTLSDHVAHFGLEHHECDDSRLPERILLGPNAAQVVGELLPHEFIHSWNGKFRRPADLASVPYEAPMQDNLLWVYEGFTDFLGNFLATRSGLWTHGEYQQFLANTAAELGPGRPGRTWRPLLDTAVALPGMFENGDSSWINWRRDTDYYDEGDLIWLWVANIIHTQSHGTKSLKDFCHLFYGGPNDGPQLKPYTFDDLVAALNQVVPYDWAGFFRQRLDSTSPTPPLGGIEMSGWKYVLDGQGVRGAGDLSYSLGLTVGANGAVVDSVVGSPAYKAGIVPGMRMVGVNGRVYTRALLDDAVITSAQRSSPIALMVINDDYYKTALVDYHGGPVAPRLERNPGQPDYLDQFLQPLAGGAQGAPVLNP